jgi:predicted alpha/beta hydrolase
MGVGTEAPLTGSASESLESSGGAPSRTSHRILADDGWELDLLRVPAEGPSRGIALLAHAMMVDRRSMDRPSGDGFASYLARAGWEVYLLDVRGHGASGPRVEEGGSWTYDDIVQRDLPAALSAVRKREGKEPVIVVGHSLCGHASPAAEGCGFYTRPPDAHVLLSANMWLPSLEPSWWRRRKKAFTTWLASVLSRLFGRFPSRLIRMGPADEPRVYMDDIRRFWREDRWGSKDGQHDYLQGMKGVAGPVLSLVGAGDKLLAHPTGAANWAGHLGPERVDFRVLRRGLYGLPFDPDHMSLVTDLRARPVWDEIIRWMNSVRPLEDAVRTSD